MKVKIVSAKFLKSYTTKFGEMHLHKIEYEQGDSIFEALYSSKYKDQNKFVKGEEAEATIETKVGKNGEYLSIKPFQSKGYSNFSKNLKREQSKYSGFAMAYAKDLVVSGHIKENQMFATAQKMLDWMVEQDKNLES